MIDKKILDILKFPIINAGKTGPIMEKRLENIEFIRDLDRDGLGFQKIERRLFIHKTRNGEILYLQYPGKESDMKRKRPKPWDFRPKIFSKDGKELYKNMSFQDIWDIIANIANKLDKDARKDILEVFAAIFYRMGYLIDHKRIQGFKTTFKDVLINDKRQEIESKESQVDLPGFYKYAPDDRIIDYLSDKYDGLWDGMSFECFFIFNELLTWNEDCKYYYNKCVDGDDKWIDKTGRINTVLTHMNIISFLLGRQSISRLCMGFSRQPVGVSGLTNLEIVENFKNFIKTDGKLF